MDRSVTRRLCLGLGAIMAVVVVSCGGGLSALVVTPVMWAYGCATLLVALGLWARLRSRPAPALPFGRRRVEGRVLLVLAATVVAFTLAREHGAVGLNAYRSHWNTHTSTSSNSGGNPRGMAGRPVTCTASIDTRTEAGGALEDALGCSASDGGADLPVSVEIQGDVEAPACFLPFYKTGTWRASAMITITDAYSTTTMDVHVDGEIGVTGFASCYEFRRLVGRAAATQIVGQINQFLRQH
jgi:hypothetical protein